MPRATPEQAEMMVLAHGTAAIRNHAQRMREGFPRAGAQETQTEILNLAHLCLQVLVNCMLAREDKL